MSDVLILGILRWLAVIGLGAFLAVLALKVISLLLESMKQSNENPRPGVWAEVNWGGLGGGLSGWRVSNAVIYLLLAGLLVGCLSLAVVSLLPPEKKTDTSETAQSGAKTDGAGKAEKKGTESPTTPATAEQKATKAGDSNATKSTAPPAGKAEK